ncbi:hypothetical protein D3C86_1403890 [compost metagenome]
MSATKLRASSSGSRRSRRGLNNDRTARNSNSAATSPGKRPINTARRTGQTEDSLANNKQTAPSTRLIIATRVSCASELASGHCAVFSCAR